LGVWVFTHTPNHPNTILVIIRGHKLIRCPFSLLKWRHEAVLENPLVLTVVPLSNGALHKLGRNTEKNLVKIPETMRNNHRGRVVFVNTTVINFPADVRA